MRPCSTGQHPRRHRPRRRRIPRPGTAARRSPRSRPNQTGGRTRGETPLVLSPIQPPHRREAGVTREPAGPARHPRQSRRSAAPAKLLVIDPAAGNGLDAVDGHVCAPVAAPGDAPAPDQPPNSPLDRRRGRLVGRARPRESAPSFTAASARLTAGAQLHSADGGAPGLSAVSWACAVCANGGGGREIAASRRRLARISRTATQGDVPLPRQHHALPFFISLRRLPTSLVPRSPGRTRAAV